MSRHRSVDPPRVIVILEAEEVKFWILVITVPRVEIHNLLDLLI